MASKNRTMRYNINQPSKNVLLKDQRKVLTDRNKSDNIQLSESVDNSSRSFATSTSRGSTMSFGSSIDQDSFVVMSTSGLSSVDGSIRSFYSYDPFEDKGKLKTKNILRSRTTTRKLPRLNISSHRTQSLLKGEGSIDKGNQNDKNNIKLKTPDSKRTAGTQPCTPSSDLNDNNNFPSPSTTTLNLRISSDPQRLILPAKPSTNEESSDPLIELKKDKEKRLARDQSIKYSALAEREHWKRILTGRVVQHGANSLMTARALTELGGAHMRCKEYAEALSAFKKTVRILRQHFGDQNLQVANALDKVGLAASLCPSNNNEQITTLDWALVALNEALHIRYSHFGPWHCDVVDTLNNIAGVYLHQRDLEKSKDAYTEVLTVRAAIFGKMHPSVAVTAQTLGTVHLWMSNFEDALKHFDYALNVYRSESMKLKDSHPLVIKALKGISSTERIMVSIGYR